MEKMLAIRINNEEEYRSEAVGAFLSPWGFHFITADGSGFIDYKKARGLLPGSAKMLLLLEYNGITRKYEMSVSYFAALKSYPQFKRNMPRIINAGECDCFLLQDIFGAEKVEPGKVAVA